MILCDEFPRQTAKASARLVRPNPEASAIRPFALKVKIGADKRRSTQSFKDFATSTYCFREGALHSCFRRAGPAHNTVKVGETGADLSTASRTLVRTREP